MSAGPESPTPAPHAAPASVDATPVVSTVHRGVRPWLRATRQRVRAEIWIVLACSLIPSALLAVLRLVEYLLAPEPIGQQQVALNDPTSQAIVFDLIRRTIYVAASLAPVALAMLLLSNRFQHGFTRLGMNLGAGVRVDASDRAQVRRMRVFGRDFGRGALLAAAIGIPGLALYVISRAAGLTVQVAAGDVTFRWSTLIALVLAALEAALLEEIIVVGYLSLRLRTLGWSVWAIILVSSLLRGSYHLYQGVPMALGNVVMGLVFASAYWFWRASDGQRRVLPLIIAHAILDAVAFIGYPFAKQIWPGVF
ncbi:CPBP family intramembrane glutamic endopeptidase [Gulosibacter bifidus]|uniref:CPBP family intramembrane glutamic endopeptidase n=1 Tax=Gulosibacter bifidus TaxID=272239 RepID=A0ABW5RHE3_9MICO|nr:CPBP family intramembrane glutamic endopeptidase [Gulosibacter bifidus]